MLRIRLPLPRFVTPQETFCGRGCVGVLRALGAARAAVIGSASMLGDEASANRLRKVLGAVDHRLIATSGGEPSLDSIAEPLAEVTRFRPDWLIAVGGGSTLDAAKLIWAFYEHPDLDTERAGMPHALPALRGKARLAAVPTTCGSGAEVSSNAVFTGPGGHKRYFVSHQFLPDLVVLDPELTESLPPHVVAHTGLDALTHAVEGYVSRYDHPLLDIEAEKAADIIFRVLPKTVEDPADGEARLEQMMAAMLAGWVQNFKVPGIAHAVAHQLARYGIPHGLACAAFLAPSIRFNAARRETARKYDRLAQRLGLRDAAALAAHIDALCRETGLTQRIQARFAAVQGDMERDLDELVRGALDDACGAANPRRIQPQDLRAMLRSAGKEELRARAG